MRRGSWGLGLSRWPPGWEEGSISDVPIFEIAEAHSWTSRRCIQSCIYVNIWHFTGMKERTALDRGVGRSGGFACEASETKLRRCVADRPLSAPPLPTAGSIESPALAEASPLWSGQLSSTAAVPLRPAARLCAHCVGGLSLGCSYLRDCRSAFLDFPQMLPELQPRQYLALHGSEGADSFRQWSWSVRWLHM